MEKTELKKLLASMSLTEKIDQLIQLHGGFVGGNQQLTGPEAEFELSENEAYRTGSILGEKGARFLHDLRIK